MRTTERFWFEYGCALLIGVDENQAAGWALPDVAKDVTALREVLVHRERCAYPADQVKVLTGKEATRNGILEGLDWLGERIEAVGRENATGVVYFTGHGWRSPSAGEPGYYLLPYDLREGQIELRGLRAADLAGAVEGLRPRRLLVVLDCCHAGGMGVKGSVGGGTAIPPSLLAKGIGPGEKGEDGSALAQALAQGQGRAVLSSSTGEQTSYLRRDRRMSIFTYHLIEALTGHAQPAEGATEVLVSDVMSYVTRRVPESARADHGAGVVQTPDYRVSGNFPVALLLGGAGLGKGKPAPDPLEPLPGGTERVHYQAEVHGSGAVAQGEGAVAAGAGGVAVGGSVGGDVVTGHKSTRFDQRSRTVGTETNVAGDVHGPLLSGRFDGPVAAGGGEAVDLRGSQGAIYKPSGPVEQQFGDRYHTASGGLTVDEFLRLLDELEARLEGSRLDPDLAEAAAEDLRAVAAQTRKPTPNGVVIRAKLNSLLEMLATADGVWGITERVLPLVRQVVEAAGQLFR